MSISVLVADDEAMIRAGIRAILANDPEMTVVAEADDGDTAVELTRRHRPDVALLDIRMPRLDGLSAAAEIRRLAPATGVVVLTTFGEDDYITRAVAAGADRATSSRITTSVTTGPRRAAASPVVRTPSSAR